MAEPLFKFLAGGRRAPFSGVTWRPGEWIEADGRLEPCENGVHVCRPQDLPYWLNDELWAVDVDGERLEEAQKVVVTRARLAERVEGWPDPIAAAFGADCVLRVRDLALRELDLAGEPAAETLRGLDDVAEIREAARAAEAEDAPARPARAAAFLGFVGDAADYFLHGGAAGARLAAYIAAYAADRTTPTERLPPGVTRFALERGRQARRLAELVGI